MWQCAWSFAHKPKASAHTRYGTIEYVDPTISTARVRFDDGRYADAQLDAQDCSEALRDVVRHGQSAVRVDADVDESPRGLVHIVEMHLMVGPDFDACACDGMLAAEEHLVALAKNVWREVRVSPPVVEADDDEHIPPPVVWNSAHPPFAHQEETVRWMRRIERRAPLPLTYAGNLRLTDEWYVDTESECLTTDPSWREAHLAGGICANGTGTGKTATVLRLLATPPCETSTRPEVRCIGKGTLVVLPLNLVAQWQHEWEKFLGSDSPLKVLWLVHGKDVRATTLTDLCDADVVFTTFYMLHSSKVYAEIVDAALGGRPRTRAVFAAWARAPGRKEALLEAVHWTRIVVDEIHQVFENTRELRQLRLFQTRVLWGLTATPSLQHESAQHLYLFLVREKAHHPNLLASLVARGVSCSATSAVAPPTLRLVQASEAEHALFRAASPEEVVKRTTFVNVSDGERSNDAASLAAQFDNDEELQTLRAKADGHARAVAALEAAPPTTSTRAAREAYAADLAHAREQLACAHADVARCEAAARYVREQLAVLREKDAECTICMTAAVGCITPCAHLFCSDCVRRHLLTHDTCPTCRAPLQAAQLMGVAEGVKLAHIGALLASLRGECVILFVQWKTMLRGMRAFLRGRGEKVCVLDGNAAQRASTLSEFSTGGVLLLCLEDSFAGLHLPHARHVVFAHALVGDAARVSLLERQAVARCVRHGQTGEVHAHSFVVADCAEEDVWRRTHRT